MGLNKNHNPKNGSSSNRNNIRFPRTLNLKAWKRYLGRKLTEKEYCIISDFKSEKVMNRFMEDLYSLCEEHNVYIPLLTNLWGDCLFESLVYHNIGKDVESLRKGLAWFMYIYKDYKNFIPNDETTLAEKFAISNCGSEGTEYVVSRRKGRKEKRNFYKYTYEAMCQDITNDGSWSKLEPHLLLTVISIIYKVEFLIFAVSNNGRTVHTINAYEGAENPPQTKQVLLGNIRNYHYFPVDRLGPNDTIDPQFYRESRLRFFRWAKNIEKERLSILVNYEEGINKGGSDRGNDKVYENKRDNEGDDNNQDYEIIRPNKENDKNMVSFT